MDSSENIWNNISQVNKRLKEVCTWHRFHELVHIHENEPYLSIAETQTNEKSRKRMERKYDRL